MKAHEIFKEVLSQGLSPIVMTGRPDATKASLKSFLSKQYGDDQLRVYDSMNAEAAGEFSELLSLKSSSLEYVLVDARNVNERAWQKVLKALEDNKPSFTVIFLSNGQIPKAIETRSFRCHIPAAKSDDSYSAMEAHAVGSWILSVDFRDREKLIKSCDEWDTDDTDLLIEELSGILTNDSRLNMEVMRLEPAKLIFAIDNLSKYRDSPTVALSTGLRLIG